MKPALRANQLPPKHTLCSVALQDPQRATVLGTWGSMIDETWGQPDWSYGNGGYKEPFPPVKRLEQHGSLVP